MGSNYRSEIGNSYRPYMSSAARQLEVGRIIEIDTDIAIFEKTETDTDSIFRKTEKYRLS